METPEELLVHLTGTLEKLEIPYAIGGSLAAIAYGEPRFTRDIDVVVALRIDDIPGLRASFPPEEYYLDEEAAGQAVREASQFNIIHPRSGFKIDLYVAADRIARNQIARARLLPTGRDRSALFSPPEELILKKLEFFEAGGSDKHLRDVKAILSISVEELDQEYLRHEAERAGLSGLLAEVMGESHA